MTDVIYKQKTVFGKFTVMFLAFCLIMKVTIIVLIVFDTIMVNHSKKSTGLKSNANKILVD
jgi:hypothetical protein